MNRNKLVEKKYLEATKGILKEWFTSEQPYWYQYIVSLDYPLHVTYLTLIFENQVINGGLHQYFANGYGQFARETIEALIEIEAYKKAGLLNRALSIVKNENVSDAQFRMELINKTHQKVFQEDSLFEPLGKLDDRYYRIPDEDITLLLEKFLANEVSEI